MKKYTIVKRFQGPGGVEYVPGQVVELEGRNLQLMEDQRFIEPAPADADLSKDKNKPRKAG